VAWQNTVRSSAYFTKASPAACQEPDHLLDPCSCTDVIKCDGGRIVSVHLASRKLAFDASKDESLGLLDELQHLDLWRNSLQGPVPAWVMTLTSLEYLVFGSNQLTGTIPSQLAKLTGLTTLWINDNHLTGAVPSLPFKQYNSTFGCCLYDERSTNHFTCPLPAGADDCNSSSNYCYGQIGVACDHSACNGTSSGLSDKDCAAWQHTVRSSAYFTKASPPACQEPGHLLDPCSCTGVIGCSGGRITSVVLRQRGLAFNATDETSLGLLDGLQHIDVYGNGFTGPVGVAVESDFTKLRELPH
jgi:hypothetical protein